MGNCLNVLDVGGNDGERARNEFYPGSTVKVLDIKTGWDVMRYGIPYGPWDVILCNHIIEHVSDPDFLLEECRKEMRPGTILDIGTPNLAAWFNRALFLFGYVPHSVELSKRYNVGKAFDWNEEELGGHIYVYTIPALKQLLIKHKLRIISITGEYSTFPCHPLIRMTDRFLTRLSPEFASAFRVKCTI